MSNQGMMAAVAMAAGLNETEAATVTVDAAFLASHFADLVAGFKAEGAKAERERIAAIDEVAMAGHEDLVAKAKAEGHSAADLALAIVAAQKASLASMLVSLDADESKVKGLRPEPANGANAEPAQDIKPTLAGEALWKSEYASSAELQAEFGSEDHYLAFKRADARGGIRVMSKRTAS